MFQLLSCPSKYRPCISNMSNANSNPKYCSKECQKSHWKQHKTDCKSELMKTTWRPSWEAEQRKPAFVSNVTGPADKMVTYGKKKYLWGNVPALDMLGLAHNEGATYAKDLRLLFAGTYLHSPHPASTTHPVDSHPKHPATCATWSRPSPASRPPPPPSLCRTSPPSSTTVTSTSSLATPSSSSPPSTLSLRRPLRPL